MFRRMWLTAALFLVVGCIAPEPIIADLEDDKVQIQYNGYGN